MPFPSPPRLSWAALFLLLLGCNAVAGLDGLQFSATGDGGASSTTSGTGGDGASGTGGESTSAGGTGGGAPTCVAATDCEADLGAPSACHVWDCDDLQCLLAPASEGTPCNDGVCNGDAECVDCVVPQDCDDTATCQKGTCVAPGCGNNVQDPDETGVDCGGPCAPCANGNGCITPTDCQSLVCSGDSCAPCGSHDDCPGSSFYCFLDGDLACHPLKPDLSPCVFDYECQAGDCFGGTCF